MFLSLDSNTMKQRDKKTGNIKTKGRRQSASTASFPHDLVLQILLRLPAKSVVRFRCVSKLWSSSTSDKYFTKSFETQSSTRPSLLMFFKIKNRLFVFSFPNHYENSNATYSSKHVYGFHMTYPKYCCFSFTESVHGLICFQKSAKPIIWNPTMRQFTTLPKPKGWKNITMFLGYDPTLHKHKVMCLPRNGTCDECRVLTLGSTQETWRTVITNHRHHSFYRTYGRCINGVVYYPAYLDQTDVHILMSFDVRHEKFNMIEFPPNLIWSMMIPFEGRLACVKESNNGITLWILESPEKHRWSSRDFLAPFAHYDKSLKTDFKLDGITHAGEFIYVPSTFHKSFYILYFDPKRNIFRRVKFEGIAEDKFRLNNGLGNKRMNRLHTFQNHIQSLMSS